MEKGFLQSKTVWGAIFSFLAMAAQAAGLGNVARIVSNPEWVDVAIAVAGVFGTALTVYGRSKATQPLAIRPTVHSPALVGVAALALALTLGGCSAIDRFNAASTPLEKAQVAYNEICGNYLAIDIAFNTVVAAAPAGKIPKRVIDAERAAVAAIGEACREEPTDAISALKVVAASYAAATRALNDAKVAAN